MDITNEAKTMLEELIAANSCDCLKASLESSCCGTSLVFNLAKLQPGDLPVSINGISVLMDEKAVKRAATVAIAVEKGELTVQDTAPSGCC